MRAFRLSCKVELCPQNNKVSTQWLDPRIACHLHSDNQNDSPRLQNPTKAAHDAGNYIVDGQDPPKTDTPTPNPIWLRYPSLTVLLDNLNSNLLPHSPKNNHTTILPLAELLPDPLAQLPLGDPDIDLLLPAGDIKQRKEAVTADVEQHVARAPDDGDVHAVAGGPSGLVLLAREDVEPGNDDLGVAVLAGFRLGDVGDLAGVAVDDDVAALLELVCLHWEGGRRAGVGGGEVVLGVVVDLGGHFWLLEYAEYLGFVGV